MINLNKNKSNQVLQTKQNKKIDKNKTAKCWEKKMEIFLKEKQKQFQSWY